MNINDRKKEIKMLNTVQGFAITTLVMAVWFVIYLFRLGYHYVYINNIGDLIWHSLCIIFNITTSIIILAYKWKSKWAIENKLLWGLLSLFLISFIGELIFCCTAKKEINKIYINNNNNNSSNNDQNNSNIINEY